MRIIEEEQLDFDDVSIRPNRSSLNSRSEVNLWRTFKWISPSGNKHELVCKGLCVANMATVGTPKMAKKVIPLGYLCALEKHYGYENVLGIYDELISMEKDNGVPQRTYTDKLALSIGLKESLDDLFMALRKSSISDLINIINIDAPNGYCPNMIKRVKDIRSIFPDSAIIAGTVVTGDMVTDLIVAGANFVRVGICSGSACLTELKTGVRRPIVSMLNECSDAAHNVKGYIMNDGGIRYPADWCKAIIAGADICMSGSIFSGTDEAEGEIIEKTYLSKEVDFDEENSRIEHRVIRKRFKKYFGMSSDYAQTHVFHQDKKYRTSEGRQKLIPYVGCVDDVLKDYEGGMRSMMCYIGARDFKSIQRHGSFYKVHHHLNNKFENCEDFE